MIDYIKYTLDGKTYDLVNNEDGTWSKEATAPSVVGYYHVVITISENRVISQLSSKDPRYNELLEVILGRERTVFLQDLVPDHVSSILEISAIYETENIDFDELYASKDRIINDAFITTASNDAIARQEKFIRIVPEGTLEQRKMYLISMNSRGSKLNEPNIKAIANTITGSDCLVTFFASEELNNPEKGLGLLKIQVLSPDGRDYRYEDIERALRPLVPAHIKLTVVKYFSLWKDVHDNFADWNVVKAFGTWDALKSYIPPM